MINLMVSVFQININTDLREMKIDLRPLPVKKN